MVTKGNPSGVVGTNIARVHRSRHIALVALMALCACGPAVEAPSIGGPVVAPDPARDGSNGGDGPYGVGRATIYAGARGTDAVSVEVTYPSDATGAPDRSRAPYPLVVFVQGGLVPVARYRWIAEHVASRGYVVAAPSHIADLAFFESDNADVALRAVRAANAAAGNVLAGLVSARPAAAMGHSLGGVVATRSWLRGGFTLLVLLASYPAEGDPVQERAGSLVLSLAGANDRRAAQGAYAMGFEAFSEPRAFFTVADMNHYDWCDGASASELASDGPPARDQRASRAQALTAVDLALDGVLRDDAGALDALTHAALPGLQRGP